MSRAHVAVAVTLIAAQSGMGAAHASVAREPEATLPLNISIDNGQTSVRQGDRLTYTIKISNTGDTETPELRVFQTTVPGLEVLSTTPEATASTKRIEWSKKLSGREEAEFSVTAQVGPQAPQMQRLTVVACASNKSSDRPVVCAAHSDRLETLGLPIESEESGAGLWYTIAGILVLLAVSGGIVGRRRLRRKTASEAPRDDMSGNMRL
ncbi:DUF11 domain-containing protein [Acrocarpospora pleiomorpha]|uniref:DUF11 domain-containing protein n=1 Tax=Acrocarpospora pleiomorpha TaxID=90975 RepID=UPI00147971C7|nr:DUF11 domain-containing protein [Acrocarpospora pleiomorpha]